MDETVPEAPRPRRAAEPAPGPDLPVEDPGPAPDENLPRRARRALDPQPQDDEAADDAPEADDPPGDDPTDEADDATGSTDPEPSADVEAASPRRTQWMAGPAEPAPAGPTSDAGAAETPDDRWRPPGSSPVASGTSPSAPSLDDAAPTRDTSLTAAATGAGATDSSSPSSPSSPSGPSSPTSPGGAGNPPGRGPSRAIDTEGDDNRRRNLLIAAAAILLVIALVIAVVLIRSRMTGEGAGPTPNSSATPALSPASMLAVADVRPLDEGAAWTETVSQDRVDADTPRAHCLVLDAKGIPLPQSSQIRKIQAGENASSYVLHEAFQFSSADDATEASALWTQQLGGCSRPVSLITGGWDISGIGDAASGVTALVQDKTLVGHTVQLARSGTVVHIVEVSRPDASPDGVQVANLLATVVDRTCEAAGGACADSPSATAGIPPQTATDPEFLADTDLPRITPGTGRWGGTDVATNFDFFGSQCEGRDLATVSGPAARKHRTYLLQEDAAAPEGTFGVDEYILTFPDKGGADTLVSELGDSISGCADRMLTAKVGEGATIELPANGQTVTGRTWLVSQQVAQNTTQRYRVAVVQVDRTVIYTVIPTGESFDFSDDQWKAVAERAGQRLASTL